MKIHWDELKYDDVKYLEEVLKLYDETFPIDVREPHHIFLKGLEYAKMNKPNQFRFLIGLIEDQLVSFATGHYLADVNAGFIVYIATDPQVRSKGLGSLTLQKLEELLHHAAILAGNTAIEAMGFVLMRTEKKPPQLIMFFNSNY